MLDRFIRNCLTEAEKRGLRSISFPALGTGNLGYPPDIVAKHMFDSVENYVSDQPFNSLTEVFFVLYPADKFVIQVIEDNNSFLEGPRRLVC